MLCHKKANQVSYTESTCGYIIKHDLVTMKKNFFLRNVPRLQISSSQVSSSQLESRDVHTLVYTATLRMAYTYTQLLWYRPLPAYTSEQTNAQRSQQFLCCTSNAVYKQMHTHTPMTPIRTHLLDWTTSIRSIHAMQCNAMVVHGWTNTKLLPCRQCRRQAPKVMGYTLSMFG